LLRTKDNRW